MIPRYTPADFEKLWSPRRKYLAWLEVELAACEAMERAGVEIGRASCRERV